MKTSRPQRWVGQLVSSKSTPCCLRQRQLQHFASRRYQSTSAQLVEEDDFLDTKTEKIDVDSYPSPHPDAALSSAKLAALHARLALPKKLPLQTLARTLVDSSADPSRNFNNASLAQIGSSLLSYHVSEWLICTYPRLPMTVLFSAMAAYIGPATLTKIGTEWGVENAAAPGNEVDPGLLQFSKLAPDTKIAAGTSTRADRVFYRRGLTSRIAYDDEFGDLIVTKQKEEAAPTSSAYAGFVRALVGSIYVHAGRDAAKAFIKSHVLSRHLPIDKLFEMKNSTRDLSRLCAREDFAPPVARLLSETGRLSRHPVFVVGIYSGEDKLGEGAGPSLNEARTRAAHAALKAWYLYSPQDKRVPSDVDGANAGKPWEPVHIDMGEII